LIYPNAAFDKYSSATGHARMVFACHCHVIVGDFARFLSSCRDRRFPGTRLPLSGRRLPISIARSQALSTFFQASGSVLAEVIDRSRLSAA
jgi:hypothetical protein